MPDSRAASGQRSTWGFTARPVRRPRRLKTTTTWRSLRHVVVTTAAPLLLVSGTAVATYSVPSYRTWIVLTYLALLAVLVVGTWRGRAEAGRPDAPTGLTRAGTAVALAGTAVLIWTVPGFTYVSAGAASTLREVVAAGALLAAAVTATSWGRASQAALLIATATYTAAAAAVIRLDPAPRIDVWYTLQGAADGLLHGQDMYRQVWVGPPGRMEAFTYLPWTTVLLAPARWLAGDVRWALVVVTLAAAAALSRLPVMHPPADQGTLPLGRRAATLLLLLPGTVTQVEQAWTEPLLLCCLVTAMLALGRGRGRLAVLAVAVALASKQHVLLLLPVLAAWPRFGPRRAAAAAVLAVVGMLPWVVAGPAAFWHDTVRLLIDFPPLRFADTAYILVLRQFGVRPPLWVTGAIVLGTVSAICWLVHRDNPDAAVLLRWLAVVLFVANLVNKQAFYNQYWLVAGLVLASWAAAGSVQAVRQAPGRVSDPGDRCGAGAAAR